jgi:hypothetical protein
LQLSAQKLTQGDVHDWRGFLTKDPTFRCLDELRLEMLARNATDVRQQPGEWLIREGEGADFFVVFRESCN